MKWASVAVALLTVPIAALAFAQHTIDRKLEEAVEGHFEKVIRGWGRVEAYELAPPAGREEASVSRIVAATGLARKTCAGDWKLGLGARLELSGIEVSLPITAGQTARLRASDACIDVELQDPFDARTLIIRQGKRVEFTGICGPDISVLSVRWSPDKELTGSVTIDDRSQCLKALSFLAPAYPDDLIPQSIEVSFSTQFADLQPRALKGSSPVALIADASRRLSGAKLSLSVSFRTTAGERATACFRKTMVDGGSEFQLGLGLAADSLQELAAPFVTEDNREMLTDLRSEEALCDGKGAGLLFRSDLSQVVHFGEQLQRLPTVQADTGGLQGQRCENASAEECSFEWGVIEFDEAGRLKNPRLVEAVSDSIKQHGESGVLLVNFLHGWRHSARQGDGSMHRFRQLAERAAVLEAERPEPRGVIALYFAWPGRLYGSTAANKLATFWNRLEVARAWGTSGDLARTLETLSTNVHDSQNPGESFMATLGHSMGAEALLAAVGRASEFGDLAIFLNPATSVSRYRLVEDQLKASETPTLIYGSVADQVNQQLYPLGEALTFTGETRKELAAHTTTLTNDPDLITHRMSLDAASVRLCAHQQGKSLRAACGGIPLSPQRLPQHVVIAVSEDIIPSHADILRPPMLAHLVELVTTR